MPLTHEELTRLVRECRINGITLQNRIAVHNLPNVHYTINARARLKRTWDRVAENNVIAVIVEGMDCDCVQYRRVRHIPVPVSVFRWYWNDCEMQEWLDGPQSQTFGKPSVYTVGHRSSDRALESYENGNGYNVTKTDLSW